MTRRPPPPSRTEAARLGERHYFTGEACVRGHVAERRTLDGTCTECRREYSAADRERIRKLLDAGRRTTSRNPP